ncbi:MAG: four-carbon acid sugar kinase family protein [Candidatus Eremiobacteraeota bacterium]|nr:four-carbon acid sugar kinase family protein [Candidatus Eremiobacteraeota bacterium]
MGLLLGAIADDFTGATDLANTLVRGGMRTIQTIGVPRTGRAFDDADAIVVALKSRSIEPAEAISLSLDALDALRARGAGKFLFKYCSTFDSTARGNIGPVADALLARLGAPMTVYCPAFPETGRRVFNGYLFVGDVLLSESGMQNHPLTPMTDSNLVRVLGAQTGGRVGKIDLEIVRRGEDALRAALEERIAEGFRHVIVDAAGEEDLRTIGLGTDRLQLITGGSGIALGLPELFVRAGSLRPSADADVLPHVDGPVAVLSGSCSRATLAQVDYMRSRRPSFVLDTAALDRPQELVDGALAWAGAHLRDGPILISASAPPEQVATTQARFGRDESGSRIEGILAAVARGLRARGVRRFVVAGGETSGAVVRELGVSALRIGKQIDPGVPWTETVDSAPLAIALKSGNFGGEDFFIKAAESSP